MNKIFHPNIDELCGRIIIAPLYDSSNSADSVQERFSLLGRHQPNMVAHVR